MNLRKLWTELVQKPAGRLVLFLLAGAIVLAFILLQRGPKPQTVSTPIPAQATAAKGYSYEEQIPAPPRISSPPAVPPAPVVAQQRSTPKAPPPIPQAIFATKESSLSEFYLPYGRLLKCELVNTVDSTNIDTPIIGLITEDVCHDGRLIIPAGTEVHGIAQKTAARERIGSERKWILVFQDGREMPVSGAVLDYAPDGSNPDKWGETDGSAGLRGYMVGRPLRRQHNHPRQMKYLISLLVLCLCSGCATLNKLAPKKKKPVAEKTTSSSRKKPAKVRTDELVKAYPVGRYFDPDDPDVMHERHTIYRVEQSPNWDYLPDAPGALPMGPTVTESAPSSSYYAKADAELMNGRQRAQVDALREQNLALQKRIDALKQDQSKNQQLQVEIERLKKERDALPSPVSAPAPVPSPEPAAEQWSDFSNSN